VIAAKLPVFPPSGVLLDIVTAEAVFRHREIHGQVFKATVIVVVVPGPLSAENMVLVTFGDDCRMKVGLGLEKTALKSI
jgi:hypothetical protein